MEFNDTTDGAFHDTYAAEFAVTGEVFTPFVASALYLLPMPAEYVSNLVVFDAARLPIMAYDAMHNAAVVTAIYVIGPFIGRYAGKGAGWCVDRAAEFDFKKLFMTFRRGGTDGR